MPRLGAHTFVWAAEWTPETAEPVLSAAREAQLDLVEIPLLRPGEIDVEGTLALKQQYGVEVSCSLGLPAEASLPAHPAEAEAFLRNALDVSAALGARTLSGVTYASIGALSGAPPTPAEYDAIANTLRPVARHAASLGLSLGLEPCNRYETHLLNTGEQTVSLIERIGEDNVFVHFDTYHMNIEEKGIEQALLSAGKHCRYIHLSESDRGAPGTGTVDWDGVFRGLANSGFVGDMVVEAFMFLHPDIARALAVWRPVAPRAEDITVDGMAFIRDKARAHGLLA